MSALRIVAWGMVQEKDFSARDFNAAFKEIDDELRQYGMALTYGGMSMNNFHVYDLLLPPNGTSRHRVYYSGSLRQVCETALTYIEPKDHQNEQAS